MFSLFDFHRVLWKLVLSQCHFLYHTCHNVPEQVVTYGSLSLSPTGIDFSRDGHYMALAERRDCKDFISVFVCDDWHLLRVSQLIFRGYFNAF